MGKTLVLLSIVLAGLCGSEVRGSVTSEPSPGTWKALVPEGWQWNYEIVRSMYGSPDTDSAESPGFHFDGEKAIGDRTYSVFRDGSGTAVRYNWAGKGYEKD